MASFRPEFGNDNHIRACKHLKELGVLDEKLDAKIQGSAGMKKLAVEMRLKMKHIIYLLEKKEEKGDKTVDEIYKKWITL